MGRSTYHHGDLAAALLAAGLDLLETEGADRLSLRAAARAAGVSPNAPYRHYADKDDLLAALACHGCDDLLDRIAHVTGDTAHERLIGMVQQGVRFARERPEVFRLMSGHLCSQRPAVVEALGRVRATVVLAIRGPGDEPVTAAEEAFYTGLWALTQGLSALLVEGSMRPRTGEDLDAYVARVVSATVSVLPEPRVDSAAAASA
ncbi:TetR/AcrR family transcriptional regulator [Micromonospora sp. NBC_01813]|uniref:TetR/AcrR family transcriptional regulator n=1 Tax=Micromonospora sp. NBC_01813 TaxID=2975988 RepID=UPI002DD9D704|nr:TetR/AcrR family transcriptional regulator [Micromonospora sp. NBC_01813]WSA11891.1 TetR/AcrR family transcriptional regulator [Micromonospora sp. NBC_01813]